MMFRRRKYPGEIEPSERVALTNAGSQGIAGPKAGTVVVEIEGDMGPMFEGLTRANWQLLKNFIVPWYARHGLPAR